MLTCAIDIAANLNGENLPDYVQTLRQSYIILKYVHHATLLELVSVSRASSLHKNLLLASSRLHAALGILLKSKKGNLIFPRPVVDIPVFVELNQHKPFSEWKEKKLINKERNVQEEEKLLHKELVKIAESFLLLYPNDKDAPTFRSIYVKLK